jgi:hypothetical protein
MVHITYRYRKVKETGLQHRENTRFCQAKPQCVSSGSMFVSVGLVDCYPAVLVLVGGLLCSGAVLLLEVIDVHIHKCRAGGLPSGAVGAGRRAAVLRGHTTPGSYRRPHP